MKKTIVFITGSTGVMGSQTLKEFLKYPEEFELRLLVRESNKNRSKMKAYESMPNVKIIYGDLTNPADVEKGLGNAEYVLHIGGMVSPLADHYPEQTLKVNVGAANNIVNAIKKREDSDSVKLIYIGSVAQTAHRHEPHHWGRTGDPILAAQYDTYAISKIKAELIVAESGLKHWVSLRQSGILHKGLIYKGSDPISFHVPLRGVLEWATVEDSARLMVGVCRDNIPSTFWNKFYNIGSGEAFRLTNYRFEQLLLKSLGCPPPEKCFNTNWFATRNFHGEWYEDSDELERIIPFRENINAEEYFDRMAKSMPRWMKLTPVVPPFIIKGAMRFIARFKKLGTLNWLANNDNEGRIEAFFGGRDAQRRIPDWENMDLTEPSHESVGLDHGYDIGTPLENMGVDNLKKAASARGLKCTSVINDPIPPSRPLEWECQRGHRFSMSPITMLLGGHWCPVCECEPDRYEDIAKNNRFIAQVWRDSHPEKE